MPQPGEPGTPAPYQKPHIKSQGEKEIEQGSLLLMVFRAIKVPMPDKGDEAAVERVGVLLQRKFPWLAKVVTAITQGTKK